MEHAYSLLQAAVEWTVLITDAMAVVIVLAGTVIAFYEGLRWVSSRTHAARMQPRDIWIRYARWLVAALTFQLAADIVETTIAPSFEDIGRLAAIAAIRTFLNFFLERDLREMRGIEAGAPEART